MTSMLPLVAMGAVQYYQSRQKPAEEDRRKLNEHELLAQDQGFDVERLRLLQEWASKHSSAQKLPGIVVGVMRRGELVFHEAYGDAGYRTDSILSMQAMVMPIITAAFLSLVDEGLAKIDDDVAKYIPCFSKFRVYRSGKTAESFTTDFLNTPITMRHLLTNTWGFPGSFFLESGDAEVRVLDAMASAVHLRIGNSSDFEKLTEIPLIDQPGRRYRVGGVAASVVAHVICTITSRSLPDVLEERITGPLSMADTAWFVPSAHQGRVASMWQASPWLTNRLWGHRLTGEHAGHTSWLGWVAKPLDRQVPGQLPAEISDRSDFFSTSLDQLKFHSMLLSGGLTATGRRVLSQQSVQMMTTDQLPVLGRTLADVDFNSHKRDRSNSCGVKSPQFAVESTGQGRSLGMDVVVNPFKSKLAGSKGTFSSWGFHGTECWSDPALELSVFVGTQLSPFWAHAELRQEVAGMVYGSLVPTAAVKHFVGPAADSSGWSGQIMNMVMMMSMMGGGGMMGGAPGVVGTAPAAAGATAAT